jgi:ankyrin repeat protein
MVRLIEAKIQGAQPGDPVFDIDCSAANDNGLTLLAIAVKNQHLDIAEYLISKGANVNSLNKV